LVLTLFKYLKERRQEMMYMNSLVNKKHYVFYSCCVIHRPIKEMTSAILSLFLFCIMKDLMIATSGGKKLSSRSCSVNFDKYWSYTSTFDNFSSRLVRKLNCCPPILRLVRMIFYILTFVCISNNECLG